MLTTEHSNPLPIADSVADTGRATATETPKLVRSGSEGCRFAALKIGPWIVDPALNRASRGERVVQLEPKPMELLVFLARRPGQVVSRQDLSDAIWGDVHVADGSVTLAVSKLRKALGDQARNPTLIETISKKGYRLVAPVEEAPVEVPTSQLMNSFSAKDSPSENRRTEASTPNPSTPSPWTPSSWTPSSWTPSPRAGHRPKTQDRPSSYFRWGLTGAAALVAAATAIAHLSPQTTAKPALALLGSRPLTTSPGLEVQPALSTDAERVAFVHLPSPDAVPELHVKGMDDSQSTALGIRHALWPTWSPDPRQIAFTRPGPCGIWTVNLESGEQNRVSHCGIGTSWGLDWSPDGKHLAFTRQSAVNEPTVLVMHRFADGSEQELTSPPIAALGDGYPRFSPNGRQVAFVRTLSQAINEVRLLSLASGEERALVREHGRIDGITWTADGTSVTYGLKRPSGYGLWQVTLAGESTRLTLADGQAAEPHAVGDRLVFSSPSSDAGLRRLSLADSDPQPVTWNPSTEADLAPRHSPDGRWVVFKSRRGGKFDLWMASVDGRHTRRLTRLNVADLGRPAWSPDGRWIVVPITTGGYSSLFRVDSQSGKESRLTASDWDDLTPSWSADGRWIYFASDRDGSWQAWRMASSGGRAQRLTDDGGYAPGESPDGRSILYSKCTGGLWTRSLAGGEETLLFDPGPWWLTPQIHAQGIDFLSPTRGGTKLQRFHFASSEVTQPAALPGIPFTAEFSVSPDGSHLLFTEHYNQAGDLRISHRLSL